MNSPLGLLGVGGRGEDRMIQTIVEEGRTEVQVHVKLSNLSMSGLTAYHLGVIKTAMEIVLSSKWLQSCKFIQICSPLNSYTWERNY